MDSIRGILELIADALIAILRKLVIGEPLRDRTDRQCDYALARGDR